MPPFIGTRNTFARLSMGGMLNFNTFRVELSSVIVDAEASREKIVLRWFISMRLICLICNVRLKAEIPVIPMSDVEV